MDVTQSEPLPLLLAPYSKVQHRNNHHIDHQHTRGKDKIILSFLSQFKTNIMKEILLFTFITKYLHSVIVESDGSTSVLLTPPRTPSSPLEVETSTSSLGRYSSFSSF